MKPYLTLFLMLFSSFHPNLVLAKNVTYYKYETQENVNLADTFSFKDINNFLTELKIALAEEDINVIANFFNFPLNCNSCRNPNRILSKQIFKKRIKEILTPRVISAILNSSSEAVFVNPQGCMIGNGIIWFHPHIGILSVN